MRWRRSPRSLFSARVAADSAHREGRTGCDPALQPAVDAIVTADTELYRQFSDNESFRRWLPDSVFAMTYSA